MWGWAQESALNTHSCSHWRDPTLCQARYQALSVHRFISTGGSETATLPTAQRRKLRLRGVRGLTQHPTQEALLIPFVVRQRNAPTRPAADAGAFVLGRHVFLSFSAHVFPGMLWAELSGIPGDRLAKGCVWRPGGRGGGRQGAAPAPGGAVI